MRWIFTKRYITVVQRLLFGDVKTLQKLEGYHPQQDNFLYKNPILRCGKQSILFASHEQPHDSNKLTASCT